MHDSDESISVDSDTDENFKRVYPDRSSPFDSLSDIEFRKNFRFTRAVFYEICDDLKDDLEHDTKRAAPLTVAQQVAACVHLLGRNCIQADSARLAGCNQSTISRTFQSFLDAVVKRAPAHIYWPTSEEQSQMSSRILKKYHLPNITGIIDGTHAKISAPKQCPMDYINRKQFHSINIRAICDDRMFFRWISASWPGSAHDKKKGCLIGDSAYKAEPFLIKAVNTPKTEQEQRYNQAICCARAKIEQAFGILKRQWLILHGECRYDPETATKIIVACTVLRNIANSRNEPTIFYDLRDVRRGYA